VLGGFEPLLSSRIAPSLKPDLVLVLGGPPTSSSFERWRASSEVPVAVVTNGGWLDPSNRARWLVDAEPCELARALSARLTTTPALEHSARRRAFAERCRRAEAIYWRIVEEVLAEPAGDELSEPVAVRVALDALPQSGLLGLGNSLPIRSVDAFVPPRSGGARVWCQRGVNGIDGLVSGAAGAAQAAAVPSLALLGDVSLLHDLGGLAATRGLELPLALLVLDNGGGRIFDELPVQKSLAAEPSLARFWLTPPNVDFRHAAALFQLRYARAEDPASLREALLTAFEKRGCTLVHAVVGTDSARRCKARIRVRLDEALERELI
jgi:2-succinyl-5-enolpyruvyl-6-hydroxy-3-cyclohexene-1-carboxylate synthase